MATITLVESHLAKRSAIERARMCACALTPGPNGTLDTAFQRLRGRYRNLLAVAPLATDGTFQDVITDDPFVLPTIREAVKRRSTAVRCTIDVNGRSARVWAVTASLSGNDDPTARLAVFVLSDHSGNAYRSTLIICIVVCIFGFAALSGFLFTRWFDVHVVTALRRFSKPSRERRWADTSTAVGRRESWDEWQAIADRIQYASQHALECESDFRQAVYQIKLQSQQRQVSLDLKLRRAEDRALIDPLTGLRNRRFLEQELEPLVDVQHACGEDISAVMIDLDNFKQHNDSCGHQAGDELLRFAGELLRTSMRPEDCAVRIGGDEFLLLLPGVCADDAAIMMERVCRLFRQYTHFGNGNGQVSMSVGIATIKASECGSGSELMAEADRALYCAKHRGRNTVCAAAAT